MKKQMMSVGAALLISGAAVAGAETRAETFSVTPFLGGYTFDGAQHLKTMPVYGIRAGYNLTQRLGIEGLFDYVKTEGTHSGAKADVYNYNLDLLYHFFPNEKLVPFLMGGFGGITVDPDNGTKNSKGAFNYGVGVKYALTDSMDLRGEIRHILFNSDQTYSNLEYGIGLGFNFGGVKPAPAPVAAPAPPPPPAPAPKAAPVVAAVAAPVAALSANPASVTKGSPTTLTWNCQNATSASISGIGPVSVQGSQTVTPADSADYTLTCTGNGGTATSSNKVAVTAPIIPDTDRDGVLDPADKCPGTPQGITVDQSGCPLDGDKDGVPDYLDKCPTTPAGKPVDRDGCHPETLSIKLDVEFDTGKADIKKKYHEEIGKVAEFLTKYPTVNGVIEGYTDDVGDAKMNQKLSERRADSVMKYLVDTYGIDSKRLTAKGFGEANPVADNKTAAGRQQNRRTVANFETVVKQ